jgi:hypothetical protein
MDYAQLKVSFMKDEDWCTFFRSAAELLGPGDSRLMHTKSYCAFTTFERLNTDLNYWRHGMPLKEEIAENHIRDNGVWCQPLRFSSLAHIIVPRRFRVEQFDKYNHPVDDLEIEQRIDALSSALLTCRVDHRITNLILEIKLY